MNGKLLVSTAIVILVTWGECPDARASDRVIWVDGLSIKSADLNGGNPATLWPGPTGYSVKVNTSSGAIYWADNSTSPSKLMMAANAGASSPTVVATAVSGERIDYIAIDPAGTGTAYWFDQTRLHVYRAGLPNGAPTLIPTSAQTIRAIDLDLRPGNMHLYVYDGAYLWRSELPDGAHEVQVTNAIGDGSPGRFALDPCNDSVYVISHINPHPGPVVPYIRRATLSYDASPSLTNITTVFSGVGSVGNTTDGTSDIALDLKARRMYWTSFDNAVHGQVRTADLDGGGITVLATGTALYTGITLYLADRACAPVNYYSEVNVYITTDNAYNFGFGPASGLSPNSLQHAGEFIENCSNAQIFSCGTPGPETYLHVPIANAATDYLYIIAYSDNSVTQGVLARFVNPGGIQTWTGDGSAGSAPFQVFSTGIETNPNCGGPPNSPSIETINTQISLANSTGGWVDASGGSSGFLEVGEANDAAPAASCGTSNEFPQVCESIMGTQPRWIWFNPHISDSFCSNVAGEFLIFRVPASSLALVPVGVPVLALSDGGMVALQLALGALCVWFLRRP